VAIKELYVGNLIYEVTIADVTELFLPYGVVHDARVVTEPRPGHPHAFAFVTMEDRAADEAIHGLNGEQYMGLTLVVKEAESNTASNTAASERTAPL
jgi:RNA recognition motif-containing protein